MSDFTFFVADVSGAGVPNYEANLTPEVNFNNQDVSVSATITDISGSTGFYNLNVDLGTGDGFARAIADDPTMYFVTPDFYDISIDSTRTNDEIYNLVNAGSINSTITTRNSSFGTVSFEGKEGDDFAQTVQVPGAYIPLTGWTDLTVKAYPATRETDGSVAPLGSGTVVISDEINGLLAVVIPKEVLPTGTVPDGVSSTDVICDVQGTSPAGLHITLVTIRITLNRDFNA